MYLYYPLQGTREYDATSNADETGGDDATATFGTTVDVEETILNAVKQSGDPIIDLDDLLDEQL